MKRHVIRPFLLAVALGALSAAPAAAATRPISTSGSTSTTSTVSTTCSEPVLYQPFLPFSDGNWYSLLPGEAYDSFPATGWTLSSGAATVTSTLSDGASDTVLSLPKGAKAVSPSFCVNNTYPYMRTMVSTVAGGSAAFYISYLQSNGTWKALQSLGSVSSSGSSWVLSGQVKLSSGPYSGWNYARLTIVGTGSQTASASKIYNDYYDPRMKH